MSSTKAQNGENRKAIFTILRPLHRVSRGAKGYIELTLNKFEEASTLLSHRYTVAERSRSPSFHI